jgi:hypothetical protein
MTLVSSGQISIGGTATDRSINIELGRAATATSNLNETDLRSLAGVTTPNSTISLTNFYGKSSLAAVLNDYNASTYNITLTRVAFANAPTTAEARVGISLANDGTAAYYYSTHVIGQTNFASFTWKTGGGAVGDYYAYMYAPTGDAFSVDAGTGSALVLSSSRNWRLDVLSASQGAISKSLTSTLQIRDASGTVLASKTLIFSVEAESS